MIAGVVDGIDAGISGRNPALLLRIRVTDWVKRRSPYGPSEFVYYGYGQTDLELAGVPICATAPNRLPPPEIGNRILLFPRNSPLTDIDGAPLVSLGGPGLIFETDHGLSGLPSLLEQLPQLLESSVDDLRERASLIAMR